MKGIIPGTEAQPRPISEADKKAIRLTALRAQVADATAPTLASVLTPEEKRYLHFLWPDIEPGDLSGYPVSKNEHILAYLRPPAVWAESSQRGVLVSTSTISVPIVENELIDIRTIDKGTRIRVGVDCTAQQAEKWLAAGLAKPIPCVTVRALVTGRTGVSTPSLKRGELFVIEGQSDERLILQWLELGFIERISELAYGGDPAALHKCPLPYKRLMKMRKILVQAGDAGQLKPYAQEFVDTSEFARIPEPVGDIATDWRCTPLVRSMPRENGSYGGLDFFRGCTLENPVFWTLKLACDPAHRTDTGEPVLSILDPLPPAWEAYQTDLAKFMASNPGAGMDTPGFPLFPAGV